MKFFGILLFVVLACQAWGQMSGESEEVKEKTWEDFEKFLRDYDKALDMLITAETLKEYETVLMAKLETLGDFSPETKAFCENEFMKKYNLSEDDEPPAGLDQTDAVNCLMTCAFAHDGHYKNGVYGETLASLKTYLEMVVNTFGDVVDDDEFLVKMRKMQKCFEVKGVGECDTIPKLLECLA